MAGAPKRDLGSCPYCGEKLTENSAGWGCSNFRGGCKAFIFKKDKFFEKVLNKKMDRATALKLIMGGTIIYKGLILKGKQCDVSISWGKKDDGPYPYGYDLHLLDKDGNVIPREK